MSSKALSKKLFGIQNETWIGRAMCLTCGIVVVRSCLVVTELFFAEDKFNEYDNLVVGYIGASMLCIEVGFFLLLFRCLSPKHYRKMYIVNLIYSFFLTFFFFNPFIFEYFWLAKNAKHYFKYTIIFHFFSAPFILINSYFITYVLWRMSKVKSDYDGDEPYLVIYGGNGSSTKQIDLDSE